MKKLIIFALAVLSLAACGNNRARTAEMLGISTVTLWRKLKKYGLEQ